MIAVTNLYSCDIFFLMDYSPSLSYVYCCVLNNMMLDFSADLTMADCFYIFFIVKLLRKNWKLWTVAISLCFDGKCKFRFFCMMIIMRFCIG